MARSTAHARPKAAAGSARGARALSLLVLLSSACRTREEPRIAATADERVTPDDAGLPGMSGPAPGPMVAHRSIGHGYGCGGHCAFNTWGKATITLAFGESAVAVEEGERNEESLYPHRTQLDTLRWRHVWKGTTAYGSEGARKLHLVRESGSCTRHVSKHERADGGGKDEEHDQPCAPAPASLALRCTRGPVDVELTPELAEKPVKAAKDAWTCVPELRDPLDEEPGWGSGFPWVFGTDTDLLTRYAGEPFPRVFFQPWPEKRRGSGDR